ncbi:MAG TPA: histidine phosphatase family protein [Candidatus Baltobacteraceae bacterium]
MTLVRHGATDWNRDGRFQGQSDIPLNEEGRAQAQALARVLGGERFDAVVSSDLSRAYDTARAIAAKSGIVVERDSRWREFAFGTWEGLKWGQIVERYPNLARESGMKPAYYTPDGGESFDEVCSRVGAALASLREGARARVLVATHAGALHAALRALFGPGADALGVRLFPAGITRVTLDADRATLVTLNETGHLLTLG